MELKRVKFGRVRNVTLCVGLEVLDVLKDCGAFIMERGQEVVQWLRHCATNWKVTGSIPDGVIRIFN
jgi:hypothetical protein